jgi:hypothetical protein
MADTQGRIIETPPHLQSWLEGKEEKIEQRAFWLALSDTMIDPTKLERHIVEKVTVYGSLNGFVRCLVYCKYIPKRKMAEIEMEEMIR